MNTNRYINRVSSFLARRDIEELSAFSLQKSFHIPKVDILVLLGNSILYTVEMAAKAYRQNLCKTILISGGIGHSTRFLYENISKSPHYHEMDCRGKAEADLFFDILTKFYSVNSSDIIVENRSINCGDNALKSVEKLKYMQISYDSMLLIQDPTMQLRSHASFLKYTDDYVKVMSFAPFIPVVDDNLKLANNEVDGIWDEERFFDLLLGELPRLCDDEMGYGPKGKNFIVHVDIPSDVKRDYRKLTMEKTLTNLSHR
jgi:Uncharacterized conserved protein